MNRYVAMIATVLIGAAVVVGTGAIINVLRNSQPPQTTSAQAATGLPAGIKHHVYLTLQTFPQSPDSLPAWEAEHHYQMDRNRAIPVISPHYDWVTYGPTTTLTVPAYSEVTMTIQNYDGGLTLLNDFYSSVRGTIGNTMTVNGKTMSRLAPGQVSHTFTIHGIPSGNQPWLFVSVPLLQVPNAIESAGADNGLPPQPITTTFSFYVYGPGTYVWQCEYPCGTGFNGFGGPMSTNGYMNGTFTVQ
jgi:hypothetical protein